MPKKKKNVKKRKTKKTWKVIPIRKKGVKTVKVYVRKRQIGKSKRRQDVKRKALPPGKRVLRSGKVYYEYRKNRSDLPGKKI